jgi:hypothetical protein
VRNIKKVKEIDGVEEVDELNEVGGDPLPHPLLFLQQCGIAGKERGCGVFCVHQERKECAS